MKLWEITAAFLLLVVLFSLGAAELERDSYPPEWSEDWQEDAAPDGTLPGTECPDGREWTYWCGCEEPTYEDDCWKTCAH